MYEIQENARAGFTYWDNFVKSNMCCNCIQNCNNAQNGNENLKQNKKLQPYDATPSWSEQFLPSSSRLFLCYFP